MDAREAVHKAKNYLGDLYSDEGLINVGLEEVDFNGTTWRITLGFSRSWDQRSSPIPALGGSLIARSYKVLRINDETGEVESLKDRILQKS